VGRENSFERLEPIGQVVSERDIRTEADTVDVVAVLDVDDHELDFRRSHSRVQHEQPVLLYNARHGETDP